MHRFVTFCILVLTRFGVDGKDKPGRVKGMKAEPVVSCPTPGSMNQLQYANSAAVSVFSLFDDYTKLGQDQFSDICLLKS